MNKTQKRLNFNRGQSMLELVLGLGIVAVVVGAIAIITINGLRNTQFSKNQVQATKIAQENLERVRSIKSSNLGVCLQSEIAAGSNCSTWDDIWPMTFGTVANTCAMGCMFVLGGQSTCPPINTGATPPLCLIYNANRFDAGNGFTSQIIIEDEAPSQKRVTSKVFWSDVTGEHSSDLVTVFSRI